MNSSVLNNNIETNSKSGYSNGGIAQKCCVNLYNCRQKLAALMGEKQRWLNAQRKASLLVQPCKTDELNVMSEFAPLFHTVATAQLPMHQHEAQLALIKQIVQDNFCNKKLFFRSIIIEWPKILHEKCADGDNSLVGVELDFAPLIHRARNVIKCRTSHPTMRIRVCAIAEPRSDEGYSNPKVVEALFQATLVKLPNIAGERQIAGQLILTRREGTPATKYLDQSAAVVNANGKLLSIQSASECSTSILFEQYGENVKVTGLKYEHGTLCAIFPELGVTLNSMIDRRQLSTRYAIQVDVAVNIENKLVVKHAVLSHEFLIAITNDQTESLLNFIFWPRLLDIEKYPYQSSDHAETPSSCNDKSSVPWVMLKEALKYFVKAQYNAARALDSDELLHVQCMLFYPRVKKVTKGRYIELEKNLFGNVKNDGEEFGSAKLRQRLLTDMIADDVLVSKNELMKDKCISLADGTTELGHNLWQWLYRATEMIIDVGHKFCPMTSSAKARKQADPVKDCYSMLNLFNSRILTFSSIPYVTKIFKGVEERDKKSGTLTTAAVFLRFCDENAGHISFAFSNFHKGCGKPLMGSLSSEQIKDFRQGIAEILMDETFLKHYDRIIQLKSDHSITSENYDNKLVAATPLKTTIFKNYNTMRLQNNCVEIRDNETVRINPLTGEKLMPINERTCTAIGNYNYNQTSEKESLSTFVHSYVQLLLHAVSMYDPSKWNSSRDINNENWSDHTAPQLSPETYEHTEDVIQVATDGKMETESSSHTSISEKLNKDLMNIRKRAQDEMQGNDNDQLGVLDLTKKRMTRTSNFP